MGPRRVAPRPLAGAVIAALLVAACGADVDLGGSIDASAGDVVRCPSCALAATDGGLVDRCALLTPPPETATCHACAPTASDCQVNGCYGGYWCASATRDCQAPPRTCN